MSLSLRETKLKILSAVSKRNGMSQINYDDENSFVTKGKFL